ncbi:ribbon-helix-helix protein, CopG family [Candidatus Acetothermia bacterium]|nr:ribbon-helix-helix protein, CopG family [Candidatus Acetothermia bacterium]MBI3643676.1 ribbon-helix-helix protein, CopG family [Candidatus Acetothermia bacterium]
MSMQTVQVRLTAEQLKSIDEKVKAGVYQSRSEAIRDYIRKADFFESLNQFRKIASEAGLSEEEIWKDDKTSRKALYKKMFKKTA